jgi:hypothetical protein
VGAEDFEDDDVALLEAVAMVPKERHLSGVGLVVAIGGEDDDGAMFPGVGLERMHGGVGVGVVGG